MKTTWANRGLLHKNSLEAFKAYLTAMGIPHRPGKGAYEVLQVRLQDGTWPKLYRREKMPEHLTVQGSLVALVEDYLESERWLFVPDPEKIGATTATAETQSTSEAPWD